MRNAVSRRRCSRMPKSIISDSKMSPSGRKWMAVPVSSVGSPFCSSPLRDASLVGLRPGEAVALDGGRQLVRERIDDRRADAVQTAGDLVAATLAELAAGVQDGEHDLQGGLVLLLHLRDGDAAAVVGDRDGVVRVDRDRHRVAVAGEGLVHRVVHDLVDEVVQTACTGGADVHARALAHGFETLEDGDVLGVVAGLRVAVLGIAGAQGSPSSTHKRRPGSDSASGAGPWPIVASDISSRRVRNTDARAYHRFGVCQGSDAGRTAFSSG